MNTIKQIAFLIMAATLMVACDKTDDGSSTNQGNIYVVNYGSYNGAKSTVTSYDSKAMASTQNAFKDANAGVEISSNVQHATLVGNKIYYMGNNVDEVFNTDSKSLVQSKNGVSKDIVKPRFAVAEGEYLYIACWGGEMWVNDATSYIAKYSISGDSVTSKISVPGGPEGLAVAKGKVYAALNYRDSVAVMDIATETVKYMATPAVTSYFAKDMDDNLYVSLISTYSDPSTKVGLGYINTDNDELTKVIKLPGISAEYGSIMAFNSNKSKLYVATSSGWPNYTGEVKVFNSASQSFDQTAFASNIQGIGGVAVNTNNNDVYVFVSENTTAAGQMRIFNANADSVTTVETGISPKWAVFAK